jgi:hypothetical protein
LRAAIFVAPNLMVTNKLRLNFLSDFQNILWNIFYLFKLQVTSLEGGRILRNIRKRSISMVKERGEESRAT